MAGRDLSSELFSDSEEKKQRGRDLSTDLFGKPSKERTWSEVATDIGAGAVSGIGSLVQTPGQLYGLATGNFDKTGLLGAGEDIRKYGEEMKSAGLKAREQERSQKIAQAAEKGQMSAFGTALSETLKDPALLTSFLAEQAPQMIVPFGAGRAGSAVGAARGLGAEAATALGTSAAVGAGATQQGADIGAGTYEQIYQELMSKGAKPEQAKAAALNLARASGASGAVISLLAQKLPGATALEKSLAGAERQGSRIATAGRAIAGEVPSEITEEVGGKFGQNLAIREVKPEQSLTEGLGETAAMATLGAVGLGGAAGLAGKAPGPVAPVDTSTPPDTGLQTKIEETTGVARPVEEVTPLSAEEATRQRILNLQNKVDADVAANEERAAREGIPPNVPAPERTDVSKPSLAEAVPEVDQAALEAKQAEIDRLRLEAGLPTGASSKTPGVEPTVAEVVEKPRTQLVDNRPLDERAANNRLLVMQNMLKNQGGDPASLTIVPHPTAEGKYAIQSEDKAVKLAPDLPQTAITRPESPKVIDPIEAYMEIARRTNTPASMRLVRDFEAGIVTREDIQDAIDAEQKAGQPLPLTYLDDGSPGILSAPTYKPRGERFLPPFSQTTQTTVEEPPVEEPPGVEPPAPTAEQPKTLEEFRLRMPVAFDNQAVRQANKNADFYGMADELSKSKNPVIRRIGELGKGVASKIKMRKPTKRLMVNGVNAAGVYRYADDSIQMQDSHAGDEHTNAHETLHALVARAQRYPTERQKPIVQKIEKLFDHVKKEMKRQGKPDYYGLTNVREFTAEAMSNPEFQFELMKIEYGGRRSAWTQFTQLVADLLGIKNTNALTEVLNLTDRLAQTKQPRGVKTEKGQVEAAQVMPDLTQTLFFPQSEEDKKNGYAIRLKNPVTLKDGTRLSGFTDPLKQTTFYGYDKNGERITLRREYINPSDIVSSKDSNQTAEQIKKSLTDLGEFKSSEESEALEIPSVEDVKNKLSQAVRKRAPMETGAFQGVDEGFVKSLEKTFFPQNKTVVDRVYSMRNNFWKKMAQGVADQYRTIQDYSQEAYMMARLSKTIDGALEGLMFHGQVFNDGGALNIKPNTKGLIEALKPIGKEVDRFQIWVALNREARLPEDKRSLDPEQVRNRNQLVEGTIDGKSRKEVYENVLKDMNQINKSVLKIARDTGLIDEAGYDRFSNDIYYIPFYRSMENEDLQGAQTASSLTGQKFSKELKGGNERPFGDLMENTLRNWSHILSASMKNQASAKTLEAAESIGAVDKLKETEKGAVKVMEDGRPAYYRVNDPMLLDAITSIGYLGPKSKFLDVARDFKNILQFGVTISPAFKVRNLFRDSISALAVTDLKRNPFANIIDGWVASDKNNPAHISALAGGAIFNFGSAYEGNQGKLVKRLIKMGVKEEHILDTPDKVKEGMKQLWDKYQEWGNKSEAANRMALYNQMRAKNMSHLEATFAARDMLDFSMQGSYPAFRLVAQVVPFMNARVQGLYKLGRDGVIPTSRVLYNTVTGEPIEASDKQKAEAFGYTTMAVAAASMLLYMAFKDDEEFQKRDEWDRDNFWWFKLPGMDFAFRVPKPFEIGAFGTMAERTLEQIVDVNAEGKQFEDSMKRMLADTFAMNPTPQFVKPLLDLYANKDSFSGSPIESAGMERLSKQERYTDNTSPIAKALGGISTIFPEKMEMSPVQMDYAIKAYFGWLGGTAAEMSHYAVMPFKEGEYPDAKWIDRVSVGFVKTLPSNQSKYVTAFYENNKDISQAFADMRHFVEAGESEKVEKILEEKGDQIALHKFYDKTSKSMSNVRQQISVITNDPTMSGEDKRMEIDRLKEIISMLAKQAEDARRSMKQ